MPKTTTRCLDSVVHCNHVYMDWAVGHKFNAKIEETNPHNWYVVVVEVERVIVSFVVQKISKCCSYSLLMVQASVHLHFSWGPWSHFGQTRESWWPEKNQGPQGKRRLTDAHARSEPKLQQQASLLTESSSKNAVQSLLGHLIVNHLFHVPGVEIRGIWQN